MENIFPTYKDFSRFNDWYRLKVSKKHRNPKWLKVIYYPLALIGVFLFHLFVAWVLALIMDSTRKAYRTSGEYRKVIKEGLFWDSIEYHQR